MWHSVKIKLSPTAVVTGMMIVHAVLLLVGARRHFVVLDEVGHIPAGISHWQTGDFSLYRVNPPLARMVATLPVLLARPVTSYAHLDPSPANRVDWEVGRDFAELNAPRYLDLVFLARLPGVLWSLLGGWIIYLWGRDLYGGWAGCIGAALWFFDPTILAFAQVVVPDVPSAAAGLLATYVFWRYLRSGSWRLACWSGLLLGIALLTKFTMVVLYAVWPALALAHHLDQRRSRDKTPPSDGPRDAAGRWRPFLQALAIVLIGLDVINLGYFGTDTCWKLGDFTFVSRALSGTSGPSGNRFRGSWLGNLIVPVPAEYLQGIDVQRRDFESGFPSYLAGEWRDRGWWYYFVYALAVKEPVGTLALVLWGLTLTLTGHRASARWPDELALWLPAAVVLVLVSSQTGFNHHMRYVLPIFPFIFVATGKLACFVRSECPWKRLAVLALLGSAIFSSLRVYPHSMSYFNELAGGPENGHNHLVDSNIDWGQDLLELRDWYRRHPEARPFGLAFYHFVDPRLFGIDYQLPPLGPAVESDPGIVSEPPDQLGPQPGYFALSVNFLRGAQFSAPDGQGGWRGIGRHDALTYFRRFRPIARAGYSMYIYHIMPEQANRVRRELGLPPLRVTAKAAQPPPASMSKDKR